VFAASISKGGEVISGVGEGVDTGVGVGVDIGAGVATTGVSASLPQADKANVIAKNETVSSIFANLIRYIISLPILKRPILSDRPRYYSTISPNSTNNAINPYTISARPEIAWHKASGIRCTRLILAR